MFSPTTLLACIAATAITSSSRPAFLASAFRIPPPYSALVAKAAKATDGTSPSLPPPPASSFSDDDVDDDGAARASTSSRRRRSFLAAPLLSSSLSASFLVTGDRLGGAALAAAADGGGESMMYSPKFVQTYDDFAAMPGGWSYKDVKVGSRGDAGGGGALKDGDRVVFDWSGYTIGYFGRPFEAKGGPQGGAFDKDVDYFRTVLGSKTVIPGLDAALRTMTLGGIRQVIVPYGPLSYPPGDMSHDLVGPKPTTFSGMRALNFVLENPRVDRTLLFNVKLIRVDKGDGKGGFVRG